MSATESNRPRHNGILKSHYLPIAINLYLMLAFMPIVWPIRAGLDPSWMYGITRATQEGLQFGKDIIFVYGPWGFLFQRQAYKDTWLISILFLLAIHLIFWLLVTKQVLKMDRRNWGARWLFILSTALVSTYCGAEHLILCLLLLVTNLNILRKLSLWQVVTCGTLCGLLSLTKFTLAFHSAIAFLPLILVQPTAIRESSEPRNRLGRFVRHLDLATLTIFVSSIFVSGEILVYPAELPQKTLISGAIFIFLAGLFVSAHTNFQGKKNKKLISDEAREENRQGFGVSSKIFSSKHPYALPSIVLLTSAVFLLWQQDYIAFLRGSLEITSGYSSAMSGIGSVANLSFAVVCLLAVIIYSSFLWGGLNSRFFVQRLSLVLATWLTFKGSFVRPDVARAPAFFSVALFIMTLLIIEYNQHFKAFRKKSNKRFTQTTNSLLFRGLLLTVCIVLFFPGVGENFLAVNIGNPFPVFSKLNPSSVIHRLSSFAGWHHVYQESRVVKPDTPEGHETLSKYAQKAIGDQSVDIIPWDIHLAEAYQLNWIPRPILQSYAAYTSELDAINAEDFSENPREFIIYDFKSIDGRHPFFDEPLVTSNLLCHYEPLESSEVWAENLILEQRREGSVCSEKEVVFSKQVSWNEAVELEGTEQAIAEASIEADYNLIGKLYKTFFRAPPTFIDVLYENGTTSQYRFIPENADNGLIVNPLPSQPFGYTPPSVRKFFQGEFPVSQEVRQISFVNSNPLLYRNQLKVTLKTYELETLENSQKGNSVQLENLTGKSISTFVDALIVPTNSPEKEPEVLGFVDSVVELQNSGSSGDLIYAISGWAAYSQTSQKNLEEQFLLVTTGNENILSGVAYTGVFRQDVSDVLERKDLLFSGWQTQFPTPQQPQDLMVRSWLYDPDEGKAFLFSEYRPENTE